MIPLLQDVLGYQIERAETQHIGAREFPITHSTHNGTVPLVLCDASKPLDKGDPDFGQDGNKRSPSGLAQEYLNAETGCLWALVSNGTHLRLLRDNPAMTRPAYLEVDFARLFEEDNYADFASFWLLLHASRTQPQYGAVEQCWLEQWRNKGASEGERVLGQLRYGVADALRALGTGFVAHADNQQLREQINSGELSTEDYYQQVLRLVYRLLFLLAAEHRDLALLPAAFQGEDYRAARDLYQQNYSVANLRQRSRRRALLDQHGDAWQQLLITFSGFANGQPLLAQPALGGLFAADHCPALESCQLENRYLYQALFKLGFFQHNGVLSPINYRDMETEEFGSVYESLLELIPQLHTEGPWRLSFLGDNENDQTSNGHARKLSGAYYTPDSLVQELIQSALLPVIEDRLQSNPQYPRAALLSISVCDPACGSGHFLLAAARRLATELARLDSAPDQPTEQHYRHALRDVMQHCIYGVDINPLAIELCKTGLWLESIEPGKPLGFLDAHIQCGNALVGLLDPALLENGIPGDAYKALTGDDKKTCTELRKTNKTAAKNLAVAQKTASLFATDLDAMPEDNVQQIEAKRQAFEQAQQSTSQRLKEDLFTAAFFAAKTADTKNNVPTNAHLQLLANGEPLPKPVQQTITQLAKTHRFFHWPLAFPKIFGETGSGGFDVMLGNPPWDVSQMGEEEYFSTSAPSIAALPGAKRKSAIEALANSNPALWKQFLDDKKSIEGQNQFFRLAGRNKLTTKGKLNLYALFAEQFAKAINPAGRSGVIVPTGIATDDSTKHFFGWLAEGHRLASLYDFENREALFEGVHRSYKFCLLTMSHNIPQADLAFFATHPQQLKDDRRRFSLSSEDFALINPNTKTCPVFRSQMDAELTKKLYRAAPVLIREATDDKPELNPWGVRFSQGLFNMTSASHLFKTHQQLNELSESSYRLSVDGYRLQENREPITDNRKPNTDNRTPITENHLPLYEAKMVHHYNHRWATYETDDEKPRDCTLEELQDPAYRNHPRYWVAENEVTLRTARAPKAVLDAAKKQDTQTLTTALQYWADGAQQDYPLSDQEATELTQTLSQNADPWTQVWPLLEARRPKYLLGWRDITNATNERTVIAGVVPLSGVGNNMPLVFVDSDLDAERLAALAGNLVSMPFDFVARHKVGGTHLNFFIVKQLPVLAPDQYIQTDLDYIVPRVLELTYTAHDLKPWAEDLVHSYNSRDTHPCGTVPAPPSLEVRSAENSFTGRIFLPPHPFPFDPERRHQLKSELDAYYAILYQLTRDELRYILDPTDVMGEDYPSETFRVLKNKEIKEYGEYRTQRLVLEAFDALTEAERGIQKKVVNG